MPRYLQTAVTAKRGTNHVRTTVEDAGSLFIKIEQENDLGIDALIEFIRNGEPLNQQIAVQIKSGQSYYNADAEECLFPIDGHRDYWLKHRLPVYGIVYVPALKTAHWVDIKRFLKDYPTATTVRFPASETNRFDPSSFAKIFVATIVRETPQLSLEEAFVLFRSSKLDESYLGMTVLFRKHPNVLEVWDELVRFVREHAADQIPGQLIYFLAHIPGHGDIYYYDEQINATTREYARTLLSGLVYGDVVKLLSFIDQETSVSRGSLGQSVEAIISSLPRSGALLREIADSSDHEVFVREVAALILAMNEGANAEPTLSSLATSGSWYAGEILLHLRQYGHVNPYA